MKPNTKIPSFTLSEMLVVLVITSIVIALAFAVLRLITQQYTAITKRYEERTEISMLKQRLLVDFNKASEISWNYQAEELSMYNKDSTVLYELPAGILIREGDTLYSGVNTAIFYFQGDEVSDGTVDGLELELLQRGTPFKLFVSRKMDAQQKLNDAWD